MENPFTKFDIVKVKEGIIDQETGIALEGWQGRIYDFFDDDNGDCVAYIRWDSDTIRRIPEDFIDFCNKNDLTWVDIIIGIESLEPGKETDTPDIAEWQRLMALSKYNWMHMGAVGVKVQQIINSYSLEEGSILQFWEKYLLENLHFPFSARLRKKNQKHNKINQNLKAIDLNGSEEVYGLAILCEMDDRQLIVPLSDLIVSQSSSNYEFLQYYRFWFENR